MLIFPMIPHYLCDFSVAFRKSSSLLRLQSSNRRWPEKARLTALLSTLQRDLNRYVLYVLYDHVFLFD